MSFDTDVRKLLSVDDTSTETIKKKETERTTHKNAMGNVVRSMGVASAIGGATDGVARENAVLAGMAANSVAASRNIMPIPTASDAMINQADVSVDGPSL